MVAATCMLAFSPRNMKKLFFRILKILAGALVFMLALLTIEYVGGHPMGLFSGSRPQDLGFTQGKFKPPSWKPNTVSSTVDKNDPHFIAPLAITGSANDAWQKLHTIVKAEKSATIITNRADYLYAEFKTPGLGFVDDVEFALDAKANVIHARSASRLGVRDFGVNRVRIEKIRAAFAR